MTGSLHGVSGNGNFSAGDTGSLFGPELPTMLFERTKILHIIDGTRDNNGGCFFPPWIFETPCPTA